MKRYLANVLLVLNPTFAALISVPPWNGTYTRYGVGSTVMALTDTTRKDLFAPEPTHRSLMVTAYYPVAEYDDCNWKPVKYMPDKSATLISKKLADEFGTKIPLGSVSLSMCSLEDSKSVASDIGKKEFPLVLFSPGHGSSRLFHGAQAQAMASMGYVVVTIDHPYDAALVEFANGEVVVATITQPNLAQQSLLTYIRSKDFSFVLDELSRPEVIKKLVPNRHLSNPLNTSHVPMYGHSLGGGAAGYAMHTGEKRIAGVLNMDGEIPVIERPLTTPVEHPYMFMQAEGQPTWPQIWPYLNWAHWIKLARSHHGTFLDMTYLAHLLGLEPVPPEVAQSIGRLAGDRVMEIVTEYLDAFLKFVLHGKKSALLIGKYEGFTEVKIVRSKMNQGH